FIGSHLVYRLYREGFETIVYDNLSTGKLGNIPSNEGGTRPLKVIRGDVRDPKKLERSLDGVDAVVHLAAVVSIKLSIENPLLVHEVNATGTLQLLRACVKRKVRRFLFASSAAVYSETPQKSRETDLPKPLSPYGASKAAGEAYCSAFYKAHGLETIVFRFMNVYGPRSSSGPYSGVMNKFANSVLQTRPLIVFGSGRQSRDFVYVSDVVEALVRGLKSSKAVGEILNVGTGTSTTINRLSQLFRGFNPPCEIIHKEPRVGEIRHSCADVRNAERLLGFSSEIPLQEGVRRFLSWHRSSHNRH
ncbi:MAG: NAD-dependent epimerase/dehydratase family protein, partial [Nitrososphaerales archaeon]